jgi:hypothetical protein
MDSAWRNIQMLYGQNTWHLIKQHMDNIQIIYINMQVVYGVAFK